VREHADVLRAAGYRVQVLAWADDSGACLDQADLEWVGYARSGRQRLFFGAGAPENIQADRRTLALVPRAMFAMQRRAAEYANWADLIVGHWLVPGGLTAGFTGWLHHTPALVICHSGGVHAVASLPAALRAPLRRIDAQVTAPSHAIAAKLQTMGVHVDCVLPMGVPDRRIGRMESRDWLVMSRLVPIKGAELVIRAFARAAIHGTRLHVAGDGPERPRLEKIARDLGADVIFHGWTTGCEKDRLLDRCRFFAMASSVHNGRFEGFPTGVIEAQLAGLVPLVADSPGLDEAVFDDRLVVPGRDVARWAEAMSSLARGADRSHEAREFGSRFTWKALAEPWLEVVRYCARR